MVIPAEIVSQMHAEYSAGASLCEVERRHGKSHGVVRRIFQRRGLPVRQACGLQKHLPDGRFAPRAPLTQKQITALIEKSALLRVPRELAGEWRSWPMWRRACFIARVRARLASPDDMPQAPFSANVEPFRYYTPRAREIVAAMNKGKNSRAAGCKLDVCSEGVIYKNRLWFWHPSIGFQSGPFTRGAGRPVLHHVIWAETHARPVPAGHCVVHLDGNRNNLAPENLHLITRDENLRRNHAAGLVKKSRAATALLLKLSQQKKGHKNEHARTLAKIRHV